MYHSGSICNDNQSKSINQSLPLTPATIAASNALLLRWDTATKRRGVLAGSSATCVVRQILTTWTVASQERRQKQAEVNATSFILAVWSEVVWNVNDLLIDWLIAQRTRWISVVVTAQTHDVVFLRLVGGHVHIYTEVQNGTRHKTNQRQCSIWPWGQAKFQLKALCVLVLTLGVLYIVGKVFPYNWATFQTIKTANNRKNRNLEICE